MPLEIFISHSAKDAKADDPRPDDPHEAAAYDRRAHQRAVRGAIVSALEEALHEVLLDVISLRGGDLWRATIHRWLGSCDGAVLLLDSESVTSDWLWKEAAILTWRASLGSSVRVVPVFLEGFHSSELTQSRLGSLQLGEAQAVREQARETTTELAARVVAAFGGAGAAVESPLMEEWLEDVTAAVGMAGDVYLQRAAVTLDVDEQERANEAELARTISHHLLHVPLRTAIEGLRELRPSPRLPAEIFARLVDLVVPGWVDAGAAGNLRQLLYGDPPVGPVILNTSDADTGRDYVLRAHCCRQVDKSDFVDFPGPVGQTPAEDQLEEFELALALRTRGRPVARETLVNWAATFGGRIYVMTARERVSPELLAEIERHYSKLRLVLLGGVDPSGVQALVPAVKLVEPTLPPTWEKEELGADLYEARSLVPPERRS
jgi:hypothetical protein